MVYLKTMVEDELLCTGLTEMQGVVESTELSLWPEPSPTHQ